MCNQEQAKKLISEAEETLAISRATARLVEQEMKEINKKSRENFKKLSFLL